MFISIAKIGHFKSMEIDKLTSGTSSGQLRNRTFLNLQVHIRLTGQMYVGFNPLKTYFN